MELPTTIKNISDEARVEFDGSVKHYKRFDFFLGKFGPFTERFPRDTFTDVQLTQRVLALRATIESAHR